MAKIISYIGNILFQLWIILLVILVYLLYRIVFYQEWWIFIGLTFIEIIQINQGRAQWFINIIRYFDPMKMFDEANIIEVEPTKKKNTLYCFHPHGIYGYSVLLNLHTKNTFFENLVVLGSRVALFVPISGIVLRWYGVEGVDAHNFEKLLREGTPTAVLPGGFEEATITSNNENRVYIKKRKGFIKYALKYGTTIYPVFTFGENQLFHTVDKFIGLRLWLNRFKLVGTIYWSRFGTFPEPHTKLNTVCGKAISLPKIAEPTHEDVEKYHLIYIEALKQLYDSYAPIYQPKMPLRIY